MPDRDELTAAVLENFCALIDGYRVLIRQYGEMVSGLIPAPTSQGSSPPSRTSPPQRVRASPSTDNGTADIDASRTYPPEVAARVLGVKVSSIRAYVTQGKLEATKDHTGIHIPGDAILKRQRAKEARAPDSLHQPGEETNGSQARMASFTRVDSQAEEGLGAQEA